jgi:hypothetical protein
MLLRVLRDEDWFPWPGDTVAAALFAHHVAAMRTRDVIEPDEAALFADRGVAAELRAVGIPASDGLLAAYHTCLDRLEARGWS